MIILLIQCVKSGHKIEVNRLFHYSRKPHYRVDKMVKTPQKNVDKWANINVIHTKLSWLLRLFFNENEIIKNLPTNLICFNYD